jgi:VWFA-related protein
MTAAAQDDVIRVDTELITFEVSAADDNGDLVRGLSADDFRIVVDGKERAVDFFQPVVDNTRSRPLIVVFGLDVSGSMTKEEIARLSDSVRYFAGKLSPGDSYFAVLAFAMEIKTIRSFTNRPDKLRDSLNKLYHRQDGLSTHGYDAVDQAVRMIVKKTPRSIRGRMPKRAVVVVTDGFPVGDIVSPATVTERANAAETSVYAVILPSYSRLQRDRKPLLTPFEASGLIDKTGGKTFYATGEDMDRLFDSLAEEITSSYAIAFYAKEGDEEKRHTVKIESKHGFKVRQNRATFGGDGQ